MSSQSATEAPTAQEEVCIDCQDPSHEHMAPAMEAAQASESGLTRPHRSPSTACAPKMAPPAEDDVRPAIMIEFCDRCRWAPRAIWTQTELFLTFPTPTLKSIQLVPLTAPETAGRFRVWCDPGPSVHLLHSTDSPGSIGGHADAGGGGGWQLLWDRKTEGGFPELKVLKQRVRNLIQPDQKLGHSDSHTHRSHSSHGA